MKSTDLYEWKIHMNIVIISLFFIHFLKWKDIGIQCIHVNSVNCQAPEYLWYILSCLVCHYTSYMTYTSCKEAHMWLKESCLQIPVSSVLALGFPFCHKVQWGIFRLVVKFQRWLDLLGNNMYRKFQNQTLQLKESLCLVNLLETLIHMNNFIWLHILHSERGICVNESRIEPAL